MFWRILPPSVAETEAGSLRYLRPVVLALFFATLPALAQQAAPWHDPSPHKVQFVTVDKDVKLEVLDWGGHATCDPTLPSR